MFETGNHLPDFFKNHVAPERNPLQICCNHVVPAFGGVERITSDDNGLKLTPFE